MYQRSTYLNKIVDQLTVLASCIKSKNALFLTDDSKWSENFFKDLLNKLFGHQLVNLNTKEKNYAGIDLGDTTNRLCVQVTSNNTSQKIQNTLDISKKYKRHNEYDNIVILVVGFKKNYTANFTSGFSGFDKDRDIWDIRTLLKKAAELNANQLQLVSDFLDSELGFLKKIDPLELLDEDIAAIIDTLYKYVCKKTQVETTDSEKKYKLTKRGNDFIVQKNRLNSVDELLFNNEIRPSLQYDKKIESFLGNPINSELQKKYFAITESLQKIYSENTDQFRSIGDLFGFVFDETISYENRQEIDDQKLLIILHNMYFNCDVGNNPNENA